MYRTRSSDDIDPGVLLNFAVVPAALADHHLDILLRGPNVLELAIDLAHSAHAPLILVRSSCLMSIPSICDREHGNVASTPAP